MREPRGEIIIKISSVCIINCFDTYEHRVDLLYDYFKEKGMKVQVFTSNYRHFEKCRRTDKKEDYRFVDAIPYKKNLSYSRVKSHVILSKNIYEQISKEKVDLLWILVPPNSFVKDAAKYKKNHPKVKIIFDLIDMWPETMPISKFKNLPPFIYWKSLRDKHLNVADSIVTECDLYKQKLPTTVDFSTVYTLYLARKIKESKIELNTPNDRINFCYLGSINNIIDIDEIARIISEVTNVKATTIHIVGDGEKREQLIETCKLAGAQVIFHGKIYDASEKQKIFNQCHYGLNIMKQSVVVGLTMKSIAYFEGGLPIINNIHGDTWEIVLREKIGYNIDKEKNCKDIIKYEAKMRERVREVYEREFGIDTFRKKVQCILDEI